MPDSPGFRCSDLMPLKNSRAFIGTSLLLLAGYSFCARAEITGQWNFDDQNNPLAAAIGQDLRFFDGPDGDTAAQTQFAITADLGIPDIGETPAPVMAFPKTLPTMGYELPHGMAANGGGFLANQWTLIMDLLYPEESTDVWRALIQSDVVNPQDDDAEFYFNPANGLGIGGQYDGTVPANTWVRIAIGVDMAADPPVISKYINGSKVGEQSNGQFDGRFALTPADFAPDDFALLFTDGYADGQFTAAGYVSSIQIHDQKLPDVEVAALGGPSAEGIPTSVTAKAVIVNFTPIDDATGYRPDGLIEIVVQDAETTLDVNSIALIVDDTTVDPIVTQENDSHRIRHQSDSILEAGSTHTIRFQFMDNEENETVDERTFTVANYVNLDLPEPIVFEDFDSVEEGEIPAGWTRFNLTDPNGFDPANLDFEDLNSARYADWTVIEVSRLRQPFVTYSDPNNPEAWETDYSERVLLPNPLNVVNGTFVESLAEGRVLFGNTGYRNGHVVQYVTTPDFDLSSHDNVFLVMHSLFEQNQDDFGAVEYSTDQGATWLPALFLIDREDVVRDGEGNVDAVATLTTERNDQPIAEDPDTGEQLGPAHGDFIGSEITSDLAPFISGRINDDPVESKRIELIRLEQADNQPSVRIRFLRTGTDSWYWGIDNFGLYSIQATPPPVLSSAPANTSRHEGTSARFAVEASGEGTLTYQWFHNDQPISGAIDPLLVIEDLSPSNAGEYVVEVTNEGGSTRSSPATLTVLPPIVTVFGIFNFEQNLNASEGMAVLEFADGATTEGLVQFELSDGSTVPHIDGETAAFIRIPPFSDAGNGLHLTLPGSEPNGGGSYMNHYTFVWDVLIPDPLNWTPFFNTNPDNGNDADFYVDDVGRTGIGALGYAPEGSVAASEWQRLVYAADLGAGIVRYYVNGALVHERVGGSLLDGRFSVFTDQDAGPDFLLFNEPTGDFTHELLLSSMLVINETLSPQTVASLGGPSASGVLLPQPADLKLHVSRQPGIIVISWTGDATLQEADNVQGPWSDLADQTQPMNIPTSDSMKYFRLIRE